MQKKPLQTLYCKQKNKRGFKHLKNNFLTEIYKRAK